MLKIKKFMFVLGVLALCFTFLNFGSTTSMAYAMQPELQNCKSCVLIEANSGAVLYENESKKALPIASVTKLMTILLTLEEIEKGNLTLEDKIVISNHAKSMGGSQIFLDENSSHKVGDLLKAVIVASANDASVALAEKISGTEADFVIKMNKKANLLSLCNTNYENCSGLPSPNHFSCAIDVATIMQNVIKYPLYFEYSKIWMEDYVHPSGRITGMSNTNKLLKTYKLCDAGKTGSTNEAGYCFSSTAKMGNTRLISVVLGADNNKTRFNSAKAMFEWGFNNFETKKLVSKDDDLSQNINLQKATDGAVLFNAERDFWALCKKGEDAEFEISLDIQEKVYAPLTKGDVVGKIIVTKNNVVVDEISVVAGCDIESLSIFGTFKKVLQKWAI